MKRAKPILAVALSLIALTALASPASAAQSITDFQVHSTDTAAGGHPDLSTEFTLQSPGEAARNVTFNTPAGIFGNPNAATRCSAAAFAAQECAPDTQVGLVAIRANYSGNPNYLLGTAPLFDLIPGADQPALFGFIAPTANLPVQIPVSVRTTGDYGLRFTVSDISQTIPLAGAKLLFWGTPGNFEDDAERFAQGAAGSPAGCPGVDIDVSDPAAIDLSSCIADPLAASYSPKPLISNPTVCSGSPLSATLGVQTYQTPGVQAQAESSYPATTECEKEVFRPVLTANTTTDETDSPSGLDLVFSNPQFLSTAASPSQMRDVSVRLPAGLNINPDAADGLSACPDALANFDAEGPAACPDSSKIGTFKMHTIALDGALNGSIYIGQPEPGQQYRLFLIAHGFGINAKFIAPVTPDPQTGQLAITITDLPQIAFDTVEFHLFASDRGLMATPTRCSVYPVSARFFPWNDQLADQTSTQLFSLTRGPGGKSCPGTSRPFHPRLAAGTSNPAAGAFSDFHLTLDRDDGDQFLGDLNFTMPPGFTGDLRGISYCPEASIAAAGAKPGAAERAASSCPAASQVGSSNVAAGPGSHPFHALGRLYFAGPYAGAPLSLVAITPALAGPYDYGTIVVRVALHVDPLTAQVKAVSETIPHIVGGVPLRIKRIGIDIDRPNFTLNPTNCAALSVDSQGIGDEGAVANFSSPFVAVNCSTLGFGPKMRIRQVNGHKNTKRAHNPALAIDLWTRPGDANLKSVSVTLPKAFQIDQRHLGNLCSKSELIANHCAGRQPIGTVMTQTPLLDAPLRGPAYAVSGYGKLPHLVFILAGQVTVMPEAISSSVHKGHLRTVVPVIPDAPVGHFRFTLDGGKRGYLSNTADLCHTKKLVNVLFTAQNGKRLKRRVPTGAICAKRHKRSQQRHRAARR